MDVSGQEMKYHGSVLPKSDNEFTLEYSNKKPNDKNSQMKLVKILYPNAAGIFKWGYHGRAK